VPTGHDADSMDTDDPSVSVFRQITGRNRFGDQKFVTREIASCARSVEG
jgi:hypothetical protein